MSYYVVAPGIGLVGSGLATETEPIEPVSFVAPTDGYLWVSLYHDGARIEYALQVYRGPLMDLAIIEIVEERHEVQTDVGTAPNPVADVRTLHVRVANVGDAAGPRPYVTLEARPAACLVERIVREPICLDLAATQFWGESAPAGLSAGEDVVVSFEWDTLGRAGDYLITAEVWNGYPEYTRLNNLATMRSYVVVGGLGGL